MKLDGRSQHNTPMGVLSRLAGEIAYTEKRLCIRNATPEIRQAIKDAGKHIEHALCLAEGE